MRDVFLIMVENIIRQHSFLVKQCLHGGYSPRDLTLARSPEFVDEFRNALFVNRDAFGARAPTGVGQFECGQVGGKVEGSGAHLTRIIREMYGQVKLESQNLAR